MARRKAAIPASPTCVSCSPLPPLTPTPPTTSPSTSMGKPAAEARELAGVQGLDPEGLVAGQGGAAWRRVELVRGTPVTGRREGLGDGDLHAGEARARHAMKGDGMTAVVADADRLQDTDLRGLRLRGVQDDARVL